MLGTRRIGARPTWAAARPECFDELGNEGADASPVRKSANELQRLAYIEPDIHRRSRRDLLVLRSVEIRELTKRLVSACSDTTELAF